MDKADSLPPAPEPVRGLLPGGAPIVHLRVAPPAALAAVVAHFWWVRWSLEHPVRQEVLSHPTVHVVFEGGRAQVVGVVRGRFERQLSGQGQVFGVKLRPGMAGALLPGPVSALTDRRVGLVELLPVEYDDSCMDDGPEPRRHSTGP